jgi:hypothetical protein
MKYTRKKGGREREREREVTGGGPICISRTSELHVMDYVTGQRSWNIVEGRECTEIISVIRLLWLVTRRNLFLDKVGKK